MTSDNPAFTPIVGDVLADDIRRLSGKRGSDDGLIQVPLHGHPFRYQVRIDRSAGTPRLTELRMVCAETGTCEIDPAAVRNVPVRRLAKAAAKFVSLTEHGIADAGDVYDPTGPARPDLEPGKRRRNLGDEHYRQVAAQISWAREIGLAPRDYAADYFGVTLPTLDRWIAQAKKRGFLRRDWSTATADTQETE
ncbi:hypothetical protein A7U43_13190 [Mycobacterium adipatum]|uniref:Uncharacterized protein n=1 Tax=Mycobacterium adipatum TaxID=1682113 RepID=A0A172UM55_9MYCO|nr:hypothetical protein [Mycobacterium adipatum]ANE80143.1 hypothetical protein A7U43_13190 [Mycobacterium adipatum]